MRWCRQSAKVIWCDTRPGKSTASTDRGWLVCISCARAVHLCHAATIEVLQKSIAKGKVAGRAYKRWVEVEEMGGTLLIITVIERIEQ